MGSDMARRDSSPQLALASLPVIPDPGAAPSPPFIVWTMQRTGGTQLAARLFAQSARSAADHEPFNPGRMFAADISEAARTGTVANLMARICADGWLLKYCVWRAPQEHVHLVAASAAAGYRHVILHRRSAADRLASLAFANMTGIWAGDHDRFVATTGARELSGRATPDRVTQTAYVMGHWLDVEHLVGTELRCVTTLAEVHEALVSAGYPPAMIAYEDLFGPDAGVARAALARVLGHLELSPQVGLDDFTAAVRGGGAQATAPLYRRFRNYQQLVTAVAEVPTFESLIASKSGTPRIT